MTQEDRISAAQGKLARAAASTEPRNAGFNLVKGNLYRIRSRNLPYGVYDGRGGFIGIREKFGLLSLFTEYDYDQGAPYGTVRVVEDLGPITDGIEPIEAWWVRSAEELAKVCPDLEFAGTKMYVQNKNLYDFLSDAEQTRGRGEGYGGRPGDDPVEPG